MAHSEVTLEVTAPPAPVLLLGPIPVVVAVRNGGARPVEILLPYPNPSDLGFTSSSGTPRPAPVIGDERTVAIPIAPGQRHVSTYFLNRYVRFDAPGPVRVKYHLDVSVTVSPRTPEAAHVDVHAEGELGLELIAGTEEALREALSNRAVGLRSKDRRVKAESAEAFAFLETPLAIEYQARMLGIEGLEVTGIEALARSPSPEAHRLIVGMLSHPESGVVEAALAEIDRLHLAVPREKLWPLLSSSNAAIRYAAVVWMASHPDPRDRAPVTPLLADPNPGVRERAKSYLDASPR